MANNDLVSPSGTEMSLIGSTDAKNKDERVRMKKQLGLLEGVAIILGIIFGSGIFITPKGVLESAGSVGASLLVWCSCGLLSMIGALCYAELGTSIPKSGGDYAYIHEAFGPLPAFLYLWAANIIFVPTTNAIMGLTFANYVIKPFFPDCKSPDFAVRLVAGAAISLLTFINCFNVRLTTKLQDGFMFAKIAALVLIIVAGISYMLLGNYENFADPWENSSTNAAQIATSFYSGIFSYAGWNYLNFMTEELKDPYKNLPRAIYISLPLVTVIYGLANVAYMAVLSPTEILASDAIAVTFSDQVLGVISWIMPLFVAISALGGLSVHIMTSSRLCFVGARQGHFPTMLSLININRLTPTPSLVFLNILSLIMLCTSDVFLLINYSSFVESFFIMLSVAGILWLRHKKPDMHRPINISVIYPIIFVFICAFLVILPIFDKPLDTGMGILITLSGIPAYLIGVKWQNKPKWFNRGLGNVTTVVQKLFLSAKEEKEME
ncbi:large neutral amino acids transporter small subunit 2 [Neocloeon triangulifer]|uniref:large neutral amino acids transporter small subunit 2 n=1 Tax=Neocloeon triangulifer TaxID=2078957 RepID=UPI00286F9809|nr:large neutral amino acids transporter small subunit 2 [Neocloeon triangulifer]